mmetsp:Transcript_38419/g.80835  ORF Transcript_38419/g.80835 Transcript_38419/m.80835 type:complete len:673 (+) Transcript_38419:63-2081(+)|eukprot:CAMPEP_0183710642 /NCGR_PEP_ID=MMETSP0737-20130205/6324_1 /TAXON_ID=385413 /ORGANISM="Thalassiosira miniscula, Strain CCMP1093" /LENGTH=672 /DNA_ID=CAMNT_0025938961 /DNA_START=51 /DNA_END=2069 /DNA_ORIENTATION=+
MDLLSGYHSSSSEEEKVKDQGTAVEAGQSTPELIGNAPPAIALRRPPPGALNAAPIPTVPIAVLRSQGIVRGSGPFSGASRSLALVNASTSSSGPLQGPSALCDPADRTTSFLRSVDPKTGSTAVIEANAAVEDYSFSKNSNAFQRGANEGAGEVALAPGEVAREIRRNDYGHDRRLPPNYGTANATTDGDGEDAAEQAMAGQKRALIDPYNYNNAEADQPKSRRARRKQNRIADGPLVHSLDDELTHGIWAPPSTTERALAADAIPAVESGVELDPRIQKERAYLAERDRQRGILQNEDNEKEKFDRMVERKMSHLLPPRLAEDSEAIDPKTTFEGDEEVDYRGRSWTEPPSGVKGAEPFDIDDHACFVPKKCTHRFTGHEKGVHRIRLFPKTGHLLLSAGLDGACKVWSIEKKRCMRTYRGHSAAVRDVQFNNDGSKFVSASFDRYLRLWNVESGEVLNTFTNRRVPYVVKFYPHDDNIFVVGCSDNKIVAYDSTTGEITQEYDHHLAPVNTITFVEDSGTKMVTSSDDKKVLVWEWDIGVPIKYISDPTMHSMPVITMHPSEKFMVCQSLDNRIVVYQAGERYSLQRKKKMEGHNVAGYACDIAISPDGRFVCSGDSNGKLFFWDFKRTRMLQKYHAHDKGPSIGAVWHPVEPSTMFTCGWDGVIKMWQ